MLGSQDRWKSLWKSSYLSGLQAQRSSRREIGLSKMSLKVYVLETRHYTQTQHIRNGGVTKHY